VFKCSNNLKKRYCKVWGGNSGMSKAFVASEHNKPYVMLGEKDTLEILDFIEQNQ